MGFGYHRDEGASSRCLEILPKRKARKSPPKRFKRSLGAFFQAVRFKGTIRQIETCGGQAFYISADVTDGKALASRVKDALKSWGPVSGVIHGAGKSGR